MYRGDHFGQKLLLPFPWFITIILRHKGCVFLADEPIMTSPTFGRKDWHQSLLSLWKLTGRDMRSDEEGGAEEEAPTVAQLTAVPPPCPRRGTVWTPLTASTGPDDPFTMTQG